MTEKFMSISFCKKRKVSQNGLDSLVELSTSSIMDVDIPVSLERKCMRKNTYGNKEHGSRGQPFNEAKECLLSLKSSVENLHQKGLFPYNPKVLLRRSVSTFCYHSKFCYCPVIVLYSYYNSVYFLDNPLIYS